MDVFELKIILLIAMALIALCFGLLPIKISEFVEKKQKSGDNGFASLALSLLSCLSGGVFLGVCLLDLMPFANEAYESVKKTLDLTTDYPFVELIVGAGFFFVYLVEEVSLKVCKYEEPERRTTVSTNDCDQCKECEAARSMEMRATNSQATEVELQIPPQRSRATSLVRAAREAIDVRRVGNAGEVVKSITFIVAFTFHSCLEGFAFGVQIPPQRSRATSLVRAAREAIDVRRVGNAGEVVKSITFIVAFTFHSCLEGFAFGVQESTLSTATLFFGIIVHKAVVSFSIGLRLVRAHPSRKMIVVLLVIFVALTAPIGAVIGIAVRNSPMNSLSKDITSVVLTCIALGTFLYVTFFEILFTEMSANNSKLLQWLSTTIGFVVIALIMIYE
ncbi:Zinc transporter ZIP3 [Toxocara canis]|uniref:Zinc transporter ZIP3 n=1 Tax=Toxocara canis TaxID=6265 RepID=A0A0B2VJH7_TOXCA|nr:Zinc transporter ZIP3 [Toxocara canis]